MSCMLQYYEVYKSKGNISNFKLSVCIAQISDNSNRTNLRLHELIRRWTNSNQITNNIVSAEVANIRWQQEIPRHSSSKQDPSIRKVSSYRIFTHCSLNHFEQDEQRRLLDCYGLNDRNLTDDFMILMANLGPSDMDAVEFDSILAVISYSKSTRSWTVAPPFNCGRAPYKAKYLKTGKFEHEFLYWIGNGSKCVVDQRSQLSPIIREIQTLTLKENTERIINRLTVLTELRTGHDFQTQNIRVFYKICESHGKWKILGNGPNYGWTQTAFRSTEGQFHFSFPISIDFCHNNDEDNRNLLNFPVIIFKVISRRSAHRYRLEGYCQLTIPLEPGERTIECNCFRISNNSFKNELRHHFLNTSTEVISQNAVVALLPVKWPPFSNVQNIRRGMNTMSAGKLVVAFSIVGQS
ncbi:hypothetical protein ACOME3_005589 [Neoechinorhynchus agilis]